MIEQIPPLQSPYAPGSWSQPAREAIVIDDTHALMTRAAFEQLAEYSAEFYCHKGVPFKVELTHGTIVERSRTFEYPVKSVQLAGFGRTQEIPDRDRMRMCRGWLNQFVRPERL